MSVLDELRNKIQRAIDLCPPNPDNFQRGVDAGLNNARLYLDDFAAAHPGLKDHVHASPCVVCGGVVAISGSVLVCTAEYGRTIGWQHSGCVGKPACAEVTP